mmetsp:Transcript_45204/g.84383  ORF Transcript_45204/g.84383 Transcript_45204/m.84383 type:complete len:179 (+) Transcript_45204:175-711(+)
MSLPESDELDRLRLQAKRREEILERARKLLRESQPQLEAAEEELNEASDATERSRAAVGACADLLRSTGTRLQETGYRLRACEQSPELKRIHKHASECAWEAESASRRVLMMQFELDKARSLLRQPLILKSSGTNGRAAMSTTALGCHSVARERTERKQMQATLRSKEAFTRTRSFFS